MDNQQDTIRKRINKQKEEPSLIPDQKFVTNLRKIVVNKIDSVMTKPDTKIKRSFTDDLQAFFKSKQAIPLYAVVGVLLVSFVAVGIFGSFLRNNQNPAPGTKSADLGDVQIDAEKKDALGIYPDSDFLLKTTKDVAVKDLTASLQITPAIKYVVEKEGDKQYRVKLDPNKPADTVYKVSVLARDPQFKEEKKELSWAFQVRNNFRVVSTLPRNKAQNVPINSGIEVTFSHENFSIDYANYFSITPKVEGRFEIHKRTLVFIPTALNKNTVYTVTIKKGLLLTGTNESIEEDASFQFETIGENDSSNAVSFAYEANERTPREKPVISLVRDSGKTSALVKVFKFNSVDEYLANIKLRDNIPQWSYYGRRNFVYDTSKLTKAFEFTAPIKSISSNPTFSDGPNSDYIEFPQVMPTGYYVAEINTDGKIKQTILQITDLASYTSVTKNQTLVWVNDLETKKPAVNSSVSVIGESTTANTNAEGVASFTTPQAFKDNVSTQYLMIKNGEKESVIAFSKESNQDLTSHSFYSDYSFGQSTKFWQTVSTDRPIYQPDDTIRVWGMARNKSGSQSESVIVKLVNNDYFDFNYNEAIVSEKTVATDNLGVYTAEINVKSLPPSSYSIKIYAGAELVSSKFIQISTYTKPIYKINLKTDKLAYLSGESIVVNGVVSFYDGTPAPNLDLIVRGMTGKETTVKSDIAGNFQYQFTASGPQDDSPYPSVNYISVSPKLAEEGDVMGELSLYAFSRDIQISGEIINTGGNSYKSTAKVVTLDTNNFSPIDYKVSGLPVVNREIIAKVTRTTYTAIPDGQYYDFINKVNRTRYRYTFDTTVLETKTLKTDSNGEVSFDVTAPDSDFFSVEYSVKDNKGNNTKFVSYSPLNLNGNSQQGEYKLSANPNISEYKVGDKTNVQFKKGEELLPSNGDNKYLFSVTQDGLKEFKLLSTPELGIVFEDSDAPNIIVTAVYFNGITYIEPRYQLNLDFDQEERKLNISAKPDKESYRPGDNVNIEFDVKDKDGNPVSGDINVSVVDESIFDIQENYINPLQEIYRNTGSGILRIYKTHQYPEINDFAGGGSGGTGGGRRNFADTAFFETVKVNASGKAQVSFKLPDNLTSWRITYQAVTPAKLPQAGKGTLNISTTQPFFVQPIIAKEFLTTDTPSIYLQAFGTQLASSADVEYTIESQTLGIDEKITGKAFTRSLFSLKNLQEGNHDLVITAKSGANTDTVTRKISIVNSRTSRKNAEFTELTSSTVVKNDSRKSTEVQFTDFNRGKYLSTSYRLLYKFGLRIDQRIARVKGAEILNSYFGQKYTVENINPAEFRTEEGGYSILPYGDSDLELSAKLADIASERVSASSLIGYFNDVLNHQSISNERYLSALYGLASLNEPVLTTLNNFTDTNLTPKERLYLALAYAKLGDKEKARSILNEIISTNGETIDPYLRINTGSDQDDILESTALAARLAALIQEKSKGEKLFDYIVNNNPNDILINLEVIGYLQDLLPTLPESKSKFTYELNGNKTIQELESGKTFSLLLSPEELSSIKFEGIEGRIGVAVVTETPLQNGTADMNLSLNRSYWINGKQTSEIPVDSYSEVRINYSIGNKALDGCYMVNDYLPSGLQPVTRVYEKGLEIKNIWYPYNIDGQKISFCVGKGNGTIRYYVRGVNPGTYKAESALIQSSKSTESYNISNEQIITVK